MRSEAELDIELKQTVDQATYRALTRIGGPVFPGEALVIIADNTPGGKNSARWVTLAKHGELVSRAEREHGPNEAARQMLANHANGTEQLHAGEALVVWEVRFAPNGYQWHRGAQPIRIKEIPGRHEKTDAMRRSGTEVVCEWNTPAAEAMAAS